MEEQESPENKPLTTFIEFLTQQADQAKQAEIKKLREYTEPKIQRRYGSKKQAEKWAQWLESGIVPSHGEPPRYSKTILDHIRFDHKWGRLYLQIAPSNYKISSFFILPPYGSKTWTIKRDESLIERINSLFSHENIQKQIHVRISVKSLEENLENVGLYTAGFNLRPWQDFFFDLMPWHHKNPTSYALALGIPACIATWYCTKKYYQQHN